MPKSLGLLSARLSRLASIDAPHVSPLTDFVRSLREEMGSECGIPHFDPLDGGVQADCLFLLEAPGPKAVASGFVSRNNPDETAKNFLELSVAAGLDRTRTVLWNVVPWYIGTGTKIRPATVRDRGTAGPALVKLIGLLPQLHSVVLVGRKAFLFVNRAPGNRAIILNKLCALAASLPVRNRAG